MCYCEFADVMEAIAALDADVITLETSWSDMELLETFRSFAYPNEIGPGVYDIHSPNVPTVEWMANLAAQGRRSHPGGAVMGQPRLRPENATGRRSRAAWLTW